RPLRHAPPPPQRLKPQHGPQHQHRPPQRRGPPSLPQTPPVLLPRPPPALVGLVARARRGARGVSDRFHPAAGQFLQAADAGVSVVQVFVLSAGQGREYELV
ncbi:hypothetical protein LTR33_018041, partial [Friedmanniomyces endolithicus]